MTATLSDFAKRLNEALDRGSTSPARLWARDIMRDRVNLYIAPNGDVYLTRTKRFGNGPYWGLEGKHVLD